MSEAFDGFILVVKEKATGETLGAELLNDGKYLVTFESGDQKEYNKKNFDRKFEILEDRTPADEEEEVIEEEETADDEPVVTPVSVTKVATPSAPVKKLTLEDYAVAKTAVDLSPTKLISGKVEKTKTSSKTTVTVGLGKVLEIVVTEYGGYITDVTVTDKNGNPLYKSKKMSLADTLGVLDKAFNGIPVSSIKKEITQIRKQVKEENKVS